MVVKGQFLWYLLKRVGESFSMFAIMRVKYGTFLFLATAILMYCESLDQGMYRNIESIIKYTCCYNYDVMLWELTSFFGTF